MKINWSMVATLVVASIVVFLLKKYLTSTKTTPDGKTTTKIGFAGHEF